MTAETTYACSGECRSDLRTSQRGWSCRSGLDRRLWSLPMAVAGQFTNSFSRPTNRSAPRIPLHDCQHLVPAFSCMGVFAEATGPATTDLRQPNLASSGWWG